MSFSFKFTYINLDHKNLYIVLFFFVNFLVCLSFPIRKLFYFLLIFELCVYPIFFLIFKFSKDKDKIISVFFIIYFNIFGSLPFIIISYFSDVINHIGEYFFIFNLNYYNRFFIMLCYFLLFSTKIPLIFLHFWLPKAHGRASGTCSIVLARLILKLGTFGLVKFMRIILFMSS